MAKDINTNINIHTNTDDVNNDFKSLRTQLREAQLEVATLSEKFGATSQEAVNAAKRAGELKDRIGDAKALTDAFNPDAKFNALTNSLAGVASGFGAVQGGMNLLGIQSESTEQALLKVQSAMAISSGLQAIGESVDSFKQMKAVAIDAFNSIKTAIGTTGIGALVIALGLVITYWDDIAEAVSSATKETLAYEDASKGVSESLQKVNENLLTSKLAIQDARKGIISKSEALKIYNEKLGDAFGKTDDLNVAEQRLLENTSKYIQSQIARANAAAFVAKASEAATKAASGEDVKLDWWQEFKVMALSINGIMTKSAIKEMAKDISEKVKKNADDIIFYQDLAAKETAKADKIMTEINANGINKRYDDEHKSIEKKKLTQAEIEKLQKEHLQKLLDQENAKADMTTDMSPVQAKDAELQATRDFNQQKIDEEQQFQLTISQIQYDSEDARAQRRKEHFNQQIEEFQQTTEAVGSIAQSGEELLSSVQSIGIARGKAGQTISKALALTQIGVDSAVAFSKMMQGTEASATGAASSVPPPAAPATYLATKIAFYASGTATILANIARAKALLGSSGGGSLPGMGGSTAPAPQAQFNIVGASSTNQLASTIGSQQNRPVAAYVVGSDVTTQQSLDRNRINNSTFI